MKELLNEIKNTKKKIKMLKHLKNKYDRKELGETITKLEERLDEARETYKIYYTFGD